MFKQEVLSVCIVLMLFSCELEVIPDEITFEMNYGGAADDLGNAVQQTQDDGYIIVGYTESKGSGARDVYLVKTDVNGNKIFDIPYGGLFNDVGFAVQELRGGGYIFTGATEISENGDFNVYLMKTVSNGNRVFPFAKTFGGSSYDIGRSVQETQDGGYIIAGTTRSKGHGVEDVYLIKTDADGNFVFDGTYGGPSNDGGRSVQQTQDGGYIIAGATSSEGRGDDVYLIKTDADGNEIFTRTFGGRFNDVGFAVQQTSDGGYIITGYTERTGEGARDVYLIKTDANGDTIKTNDNMVFVKAHGGPANDQGQSVQQTSDGGYIITGTTLSTGPGGNDVYLLKTDAKGDTFKINGNIPFLKIFGGVGNELGQSVQQTRDGGYIVTGHNASKDGGDVYLIKTNAYGEAVQ